MDYYRVLELFPGASQEEIKKSYRKLARMYHPDSSGVQTLDKDFRDIQQAYEVLSDPQKKQVYDKQHGFDNWTEEKLQTYRRAQADAEAFMNRGKLKSNYDEDRLNVLQNQALQNKKLSQARSQRAAGSGKLRFTGSSIFSRPGADSGDTSSRYTDTLIGRLKAGLKETMDRGSGKIARPRKPTEEYLQEHLEQVRQTMRDRSSASDPSGVHQERYYHFTIDALESLTGTSREIALDDKRSPRMVRVKIPGGVRDEQILRITCPQTEVHSEQLVRIKVSVVAHELVEREGLDIIVKVPITVGEALTGTELQVPTLEGPVKVKIPAGWNETRKLRLKDRGVKDSHSGEIGDLYVTTPIIFPERIEEETIRAATHINTLYDKDVRGKVPRSLKRG